MADLSDADYEAANRRGEIEMRTRPRARAVRYDRQSDRIVVDLVNGATFAFPPRLAQGLETASVEDLEQVEVIGVGFGLHWETLNADLLIEGLMAGRFGSARYMAERFGREWDVVAAE